MDISIDRKSDNFKEVETRLEEMFAGIEDENETKLLPTEINFPVNHSENENKPLEEDVVEIAECLTQELDEKEANKKDETPEKSEIPEPVPEISLKPVINDPPPKKKKPTESAPRKRKPPAKKVFKFDKSAGGKLDKNKKTSETAKKEESNLKIKGPYVQIKPDSTVCVNNSSSEEYLENKMKKINSNSVKNEINKLRGLYVSTLSTKYDADTTDISWLCVFCKKGPHKMGLGDLYGPYIIQSNSETQENGDTKIDIADAISNIKKKKIENITECPKQVVSTGMTQVSDNTFEIWCHEDCIIWAPGVYLIGLKLVGLENAVWSSSLNECSYCELNGAILCCLSRGCTKNSHFPCGKIQNWLLDEENFKIYCPDHMDMND